MSKPLDKKMSTPLIENVQIGTGGGSLSVLLSLFIAYDIVK